MAEASEIRKQFIAEHKLKSELETRGVKLIGEGDKRKARCPFHEDKNPSFSINLTDGTWNCFAGCGGGSVVELIARFEGVLPTQIIEAYRKSKNGDGDGLKKEKSVNLSPPVNWNDCVSAFDDGQAFWVATERGYRPEFVDQLRENKMIGLCEGHISFPIFTAGKVSGTHQRLTSGSWITRGGQDKPWIIGDHFENVFLFESQWDAFAMMDMIRWFDAPQVRATCAIVITRGSSKGKAIQNMFPTRGRVTAVMQNDKADAKGHIAADNWLSDVVSVLGSIFVVRVPSEHKDLNDWYRAGATGHQVIDLIESAARYRDPSLPPIPAPLDFDKLMDFDSKNDPNCLLGRRYLGRGGSCLWIGSSGLGKSVMTIQAAMTFARKSDLFGLEPHRPLRSIIIGAEDDFGDLAEMVQGVLRGMGIERGSLEYNLFKENVLIFPKDGLSGLALVGWAESLVREFKADLLWINPLLSYIACDINSSEEVSVFTGALSNMQANTGVCVMIVHHTGKPKETKTVASWSADDFSYIGLGSSALTNWARAIIVIQSLKDPIDTFVMRFAKRGNRTGIVDETFTRVREVYLEHAKVGLCWVKSDYVPEEKDPGGRPKKGSWEAFKNEWDGTPISNLDLRKRVSEVLSVTDRTAYRVLSEWTGKYIIKNVNDLWIKV